MFKLLCRRCLRPICNVKIFITLYHSCCVSSPWVAVTHFTVSSMYVRVIIPDKNRKKKNTRDKFLKLLTNQPDVQVFRKFRHQIKHFAHKLSNLFLHFTNQSIVNNQSIESWSNNQHGRVDLDLVWKQLKRNRKFTIVYLTERRKYVDLFCTMTKPQKANWSRVLVQSGANASFKSFSPQFVST